MRKILLLIFSVLIASNAYADCSYDNVSLEYADDGRVIVGAMYYLDGVLLTNNKDNKDYKAFSPKNFLDSDGTLKTDANILKAIRDVLDNHCERLIYVAYRGVSGHPSNEGQLDLLNSKVKAKIDSLNAQIIGAERTIDKAEVFIDTDGDNQYDQRWDIEPNGTKTKTNITPIPIGSN